MSTEHWDHGKCPKYDCKKDACKCGLKKVFLASVLGDDGKDSPIAPKNGAYCNAIVAYEANGHIYIYSSEGIPTLVETEGSGLEEAIKKLEDDLANEVTDRAAADNVLQTEIDDLKNSPDVVDIVPTYAALQAYDTSKLGDNDIIRVLQDETHDGQSTYYRWNKQSSAWTYIGAVGDYYTKGQVDTLLTGKQNTLTAGANVQISPENVISATDTTYTHFTGATSSADGTAGLVPAPVAGDDTKFLSGDGTWGTPAGTTYTAGTNVQISAQNVISATDTTYSAFTGTDGQAAGAAGLVPAPATTDAGKFLNADGSWEVAGGGGAEFIELTTADYNWNSSTGQTGTPNCVALWLLPSGIYKGPASTSIEVRATRTQDYSMGAGFSSYAIVKECENTNTNRAIVTYVDGANGSVVEYYSIDENGQNYSTKNFPNVVQSTGTSTTNVMSQKAVTDTIFEENDTGRIKIGTNSDAKASSVSIGEGAGQYSAGNTIYSVALGAYSGRNLPSGISFSVALGSYATPTRKGEVNIGTGTTTNGYNSTKYRVLGGVHDPQSDHDAATKGYVDGLIGACRELTSADYNYDSDGDTVNDTVALWLLPPGVYWWEYSFGSNGGVKFTTSSSGTLMDAKLLTFSQQVMIGYYGDANSGFSLIKAFSRNILSVSSDFGWAPYVPYVVNTSTGAVVNFQASAIPVGRGDVNI